MVADGEKYATGNALPNIITGNGGTNVITGGLANDILTGGAGKDTFVFERGDGSDIITDFEAGTDGSESSASRTTASPLSRKSARP